MKEIERMLIKPLPSALLEVTEDEYNQIYYSLPSFSGTISANRTSGMGVLDTFQAAKELYFADITVFDGNSLYAIVTNLLQEKVPYLIVRTP